MVCSALILKFKCICRIGMENRLPEDRDRSILPWWASTRMEKEEESGMCRGRSPFWIWFLKNFSITGNEVLFHLCLNWWVNSVYFYHRMCHKFGKCYGFSIKISQMLSGTSISTLLFSIQSRRTFTIFYELSMLLINVKRIRLSF